MAFLESRGLREIHIADIEQRRREKTATFPTPLPDSAYCDNWIGENALALMQRFPADKPWFLQVNFTGPHEPWDITETMATWYAGATFPPPVNDSAIPLAKHNAVRANYAAMIENIDRWVGRLLQEVRRRGEEDETIIVFSSDHGDMLGDHGRWGKIVPYHPSLAVPLIVAGPGVQPNRIHDRPSTILDLPATFLDLAGAEPLRDAESQSLRPILEGASAAGRHHVFAALNEWQAVYDGRYKLIENFHGESLLFDLREDPGETRNRASDLVEDARRLHSLFNHPQTPDEDASRK
jgi:arylsulfatase A-like enzyme